MQSLEAEVALEVGDEAMDGCGSKVRVCDWKNDAATVVSSLSIPLLLSFLLLSLVIV